MNFELEYEAVFILARIRALRRIRRAINHEIDVLETRINDIRRAEDQERKGDSDDAGKPSTDN